MKNKIFLPVCLTIIFIFALANIKAFAHDDSATQRINKIIVQGENVHSYSIDKNRIEDIYSEDKTTLSNSYRPMSFFAANLNSGQVENYPFRFTVITMYHPSPYGDYFHQHPFSWDILTGNFFYISVSETVAHDQRGFALAIASPAAFEEYKNNPPEEYPNRKKVIYPDSGLNMGFLDHLFIESDIHQIDARHGIFKKVSYDFYASGTNSADVYVYYTNEPFQLWRYENNTWTKLATFDIPFEGPFRVFKKTKGTYLLSDSGHLFKIEGVDADQVEKVTLKEILVNPEIQFVIDDKNKDELFFVTKDKIIPLSNTAQTKPIAIGDLTGLEGEEFLKQALKVVQAI